MKTASIALCLGLLLLAGDCAAADGPANETSTEAGSPATLLADAVERSDMQAVRALLKRHGDVNASHADGMTALHWAAYHDDRRMAELLVAAGTDVQAVNRYGVAPLSIACRNGSQTIVALLLEAGADPNQSLRGGETALMTAARTGRIAVVEALLARGADIHAREASQQTALMWAAAEGHADVVQALLQAGADFRTPLDSGFTPLLFAAREGKADVVRTLLAAGADVTEATRPKRKPFGGPDEGVSPLLMAVENGHFELAAALLEAGADPNDQRSGFTALHVITWVRKPDSGDGNGQPPPDGSGNLTSLDMVRRLVEHGANVNTQLKKGGSGHGKLSRQGATPFLMAADTADAPLMRLLIELGADPLIPNATHSTPLMAAAGLGTLAPGEEAGTEDEALEAVRLALELGGDVNAVDDNGETAVHGAAYASFPRVVRFLADHGAEVAVWNREDKYGWTPLSIAQGHRPEIFQPSQETIDALLRVMPVSDAPEDSNPPKASNDH